jgi:hypothetical protein
VTSAAAATAIVITASAMNKAMMIPVFFTLIIPDFRWSIQLLGLHILFGEL